MRSLSRRVLAVYGRTLPISARDVQVNAPAPDGLTFLLIRDGAVGHVDARGCLQTEAPAGPEGILDPLSVDQVCDALGRRIRCSADGIASLRIDARPLDMSPALLFLVAHELAHVALGHSGRFGEPLGALSLSLDRQTKLKVLGNQCRKDVDELRKEIAADELAQSALAELLTEPPFLEPVAGRGGSLTFSAARIRHEAAALDRWGRRRVGAPSDKVLSLGKGALCTVLRARTGGVALPPLGGAHPHGERRLANLSARLRGAAAKVSNNRAFVDPSHPGSKIGNFTDLVRDMGAIDAAMDEQDATATDEDSNAFCQDVYDAEQAPTPVCP
jgi:hypothetical protein